METRPPIELLGPLNEVERRFSPQLFWYEGDASLARSGARVSVVGTREVSDDGRRRTIRLVKFLVEHHVTVVSGLAVGVDTVALTTAIELGGRVIAVIGTGLDTAYPKENRTLQDQIARDHLLVSQFAPKIRLSKGNFPQRNRTMGRWVPRRCGTHRR